MLPLSPVQSETYHSDYTNYFPSSSFGLSFLCRTSKNSIISQPLYNANSVALPISRIETSLFQHQLRSTSLQFAKRQQRTRSPTLHINKIPHPLTHPFKCSELWLRYDCCCCGGLYAGEPTIYGPTTLISGHIDRGPSSRTASSSAADNHVYRFGSIVGVIPPLPLRVKPPAGCPLLFWLL